MNESLESVVTKYRRIAKWYDIIQSPLENLILKHQRRRLFSRVSGHVCEIGVGTGKNFQFYPKSISLTGIDVSENMLAIAKKRAARYGLRVDLRKMDAEMLQFPDQSFDFIVSSLVLCTIPNPVKAIREMFRVCRTGGNLLFLEHGLSSTSWVRSFQRSHPQFLIKRFGCHWDRGPLQLLNQAGLTDVLCARAFFGIFYSMSVEKK